MGMTQAPYIHPDTRAGFFQWGWWINPNLRIQGFFWPFGFCVRIGSFRWNYHTKRILRFWGWTTDVKEMSSWKRG